MCWIFLPPIFIDMKNLEITATKVKICIPRGGGGEGVVEKL